MGGAALLCAPAIVRASSLMPVKPTIPSCPPKPLAYPHWILTLETARESDFAMALERLDDAEVPREDRYAYVIVPPTRQHPKAHR